MQPIYIYQSLSYTSYSLTPPDEEQISLVAAKHMRILKVEGGKVYGMLRAGGWKHIPDGNALRQVIKHICPVIESDEE